MESGEAKVLFQKIAKSLHAQFVETKLGWFEVKSFLGDNNSLCVLTGSNVEHVKNGVIRDYGSVEATLVIKKGGLVEKTVHFALFDKENYLFHYFEVNSSDIKAELGVECEK